MSVAMPAVGLTPLTCYARHRDQTCPGIDGAGFGRDRRRDYGVDLEIEVLPSAPRSAGARRRPLHPLLAIPA